MDFNFQTLFSHLTDDQMKAILQDFWRKNEENHTEMGILQRKEAESQNEISRLRQEINDRDKKISLLNDESERTKIEFERKIKDLNAKNSQLEKKIDGQTLSCPVCHENFDTEDHQPFALSCPHMVCARCLYPAALMTQCSLADEFGKSPEMAHPSNRYPVCRTVVTTQLKKIWLNS